MQLPGPINTRIDMAGTPIIDSFRNDYDFLSNFYFAPVEWQGQKFRTSEHAYQWAKTLDPFEKENILKHNGCPTTPGQAKKYGAECTLREDWSEYQVQAMREILFAKFTQNWGLRQKLLATDAAILIEGNSWHDNDWGSCRCEGCGDKGRNMLGNLLMELRDRLRKPEPIYCHGCPVAPSDKL